MGYLFKRLLSYFIDLLIISIVVSLISCIPFFYNSIEKYQNVNKEYTEDLSNDYDFISKYGDKEFDGLEDHKSSLSKYITSDNLSDEEYNDNIDKISSEVIDKSKKYSYNSLKLQMPISVLSIVVTFLYFMICPLIIKGRTIGMNAFKLKYSKDELSFNNYLIRSLFLTGGISFVTSSIALYNMDYLKFYYVYLVIGIIKFIYNFINVIMIACRSNHRGLNDLIAGTEIVGG